jgi:hypothetical protein
MPSDDPSDPCRGPSEDAEDTEEWLGWIRDAGETCTGGIDRRWKMSLWPEALDMEARPSLMFSRGGEDARRLTPALVG